MMIMNRAIGEGGGGKKRRKVSAMVDRDGPEGGGGREKGDGMILRPCKQ